MTDIIVYILILFHFLIEIDFIYLRQIHHIEEENSEIKRLAIYEHPNEMWDLSSCPYDASLLFSVSNAGTSLQKTP